MPSLPPGTDPTEITTAARRVLLDALETLRDHLPAIVLVGAQAVYLRSADADFSTSAYTTDADLGLDRRLLEEAPLLDAAMRGAGFRLRQNNQPGLWVRTEEVGDGYADIEVDLLVPESEAGRGSRSAEIPPHDKMAARRVAGIEVAMVDNDLVTVGALDPADDRTVEVRVAGVAALLVAKGYKLGERADAGGARLNDKDAADVYRLMATSDPYAVAERFGELVTDERVGAVARAGLAYLRQLFGDADAIGVQLATSALRVGGPAPETIAATAVGFVSLLPQVE